MQIAVASGKGGTGKTLVATNLAVVLGAAYVDCDVEGANGHLFLKPLIAEQRPAEAAVPHATDDCTGCGACARACRFGAIAALKTGVLVFNELCHSCGACLQVCPADALHWTSQRLGQVRTGTYRIGRAPVLPFADGELAIGQVRASAVIEQVKAAVAEAPHAVLDCPPGCSCAVAEAVRGADLCLLVTEPTPFGLSDLEKALGLVRYLGIPHAVILNRSDLAGTDVPAFCRKHGVPIVMELRHDMAVARACAEGRLVAVEMAPYRRSFETLAEAIDSKVLDVCPAPSDMARHDVVLAEDGLPGVAVTADADGCRAVKVAIVSGKGGTGKTSLAASLAALRSPIAVADADVDAANLHLLLRPTDETPTPFSGAYVALIDPEKCRGCGVCANECRFEAITLTPRATVDPLRCEGCGLCALVCPLADAPDEMPVRIVPRLSGHAYAGTAAAGPMARGELLPGGEASGKLVTLVRTLAESRAADARAEWVLIDASPGTGCPVNAALAGCGFAIIVTEPTQGALHDLERAMDLTAWFGVRAAVVINKSDIWPHMAEHICAACRSRGTEVIGHVPFDPQVPENLSRGVIPVLGDGPGAAALRRVCRTLIDRVEALASPTVTVVDHAKEE